MILQKPLNYKPTFETLDFTITIIFYPKYPLAFKNITAFG